jgi:hypothetical protein
MNGAGSPSFTVGSIPISTPGSKPKRGYDGWPSSATSGKPAASTRRNDSSSRALPLPWRRDRERCRGRDRRLVDVADAVQNVAAEFAAVDRDELELGQMRGRVPDLADELDLLVAAERGTDERLDRRPVRGRRDADAHAQARTARSSSTTRSWSSRARRA